MKVTGLIHQFDKHGNHRLVVNGDISEKEKQELSAINPDLNIQDKVAIEGNWVGLMFVATVQTLDGVRFGASTEFYQDSLPRYFVAPELDFKSTFKKFPLTVEKNVPRIISPIMNPSRQVN